MLTLTRELPSRGHKEFICPHCSGFREEDFLDISVAEEFMMCMELKEIEVFDKPICEMTDKELKAAAWVIYHEWSKGCISYELIDLHNRKTNFN